MNAITNSNQPVFGMRERLKPADTILRKAKNTYQHLSPHNLSSRIEKAYNLEMDPLYLNSEPYIEFIEKKKNISINRKLLYVLRKFENKLVHYRNLLKSSLNPVKFLIEELKNGGKLGNSSEEVALATIIGRINGQKNIYAGHINGLDHGVTFITNKPVEKGKKLFFKNKDAIIIDPQLGITDYADNYFLKIKDLIKTPFKKKPHFSVTPSDNFRLNDAQTEDLKKHYPELLIENFRPVKV